MDSALNDALRHDSVQFFELLLEQGASIDRLRRMIKINDLYKTVSKFSTFRINPQVYNFIENRFAITTTKKNHAL